MAYLAKCFKVRQGASSLLFVSRECFDMLETVLSFRCSCEGSHLSFPIWESGRRLRGSSLFRHGRDSCHCPPQYYGSCRQWYKTIQREQFRLVSHRWRVHGNSYCSDSISLRCESCYHFLQPSGCCHHFQDGVPFRHELNSAFICYKTWGSCHWESRSLQS